MPYAMPNEALVDVLLPAYTCQHFGKCPDATWFPSEGHVPRGFLGATRALEEVEVVMVLAEPGPPKDTKPNSEKYEHSDDDPKATLERVVKFVYGCYDEAIGPPHNHVRWFLECRYGRMLFDEQLRRVWITEARLCSIRRKGKPPMRWYTTCEAEYLHNQLRTLEHASVVAFGGKAHDSLRRLGWPAIEAIALALPGCSQSGARPSWEDALRKLPAPNP